MANVQITQLPAAGAITGSELVPVVQNGVTVKATTAAIAGSPVQTQTFLTKNNEPTLTNSRALSNGTGVGLVDGGAQSTLTITLNAASGSLEAASNGMIAKTASNAVAARTLTATGNGLAITDGTGVSGDPTFALSGVAAAVAGATGVGALALTSPTTVSTRTILGTSSQIAVTDGNFANSPVIAIASNPIVPGTGGLVVPTGTTGQRGSSINGNIRYNTTSSTFEGYANNAWGSIITGVGVSSVDTGTGLTGGPITSTGTISIDNTGVVAATYGSAAAVPVFAVNAQGQLTGVTNTTIAIPSTQVSGLGTMATQNANSVTITGGTISGLGTPIPVASGGTGAGTLTGYVTGAGTSALTAVSTIPSTDITGLGTMSTQNANAVAITGGAISNATGSFTTLAASSTVSGTGFSAYLASPPPIGATAPSTGKFTSVILTSGTIATAPSNGTDIVNKLYADSIASGLNFHEAVQYATTTTLSTYTYNNGASGVGATITAVANGALSLGGGSPSATQRVLVKDEISANAPYNGIYTVTSAGSSITPFVLTRATDYDSSGAGVNEIDQGDYVLVVLGTLASTAWVQQTALPITVGVTALTFIQFNAPIVYVAGTGLNLSPSTTFNIATTGVAAASYGTASSVPTLGINAQGQVTSASNTAIAINGNQVTAGVVGLTFGGTGQTTATTAFNALSPITSAGDLILGNGANSATRLAIGGNGYLLTSNGSTASWVAASATGVTTFSAGTTGFTPASATAGAVTLAGTLAIANGGTNSVATATAGGASYGTGTAFAFTAAGTAGQVLTSAGAGAPIWSGISGGVF